MEKTIETKIGKFTINDNEEQNFTCICDSENRFLGNYYADIEETERMLLSMEEIGDVADKGIVSGFSFAKSNEELLEIVNWDLQSEADYWDTKAYQYTMKELLENDFYNVIGEYRILCND